MEREREGGEEDKVRYCVVGQTREQGEGSDFFFFTVVAVFASGPLIDFFFAGGVLCRK